VYGNYSQHTRLTQERFEEARKIALHLAGKCRLKFTNLQCNGHQAFQPSVREPQVDAVFFPVHF
jgi:hypothetical protein